MKAQAIKIIPMYRTSDYYRNEERYRGECEYQCICCGRKLNPRTMKQAQAIAPGYFVEIGIGNIPEIITEAMHQEPMGWYEVGPECYKEIKSRLAASDETMEVYFN